MKYLHLECEMIATTYSEKAKEKLKTRDELHIKFKISANKNNNTVTPITYQPDNSLCIDKISTIVLSSAKIFHLQKNESL